MWTRSVRLALFLFVTFTLSSVVAQPNELSNIARIQSSALEIYDRFDANMSSVKLYELMHQRIMEHTYHLIDRIHSWDVGNIKNVNEGLDFLRSYAVSLCLEYAHRLYEAYCVAGYNCAEITPKALRIYQIFSNWQWKVVPSDPSTCFEVMQLVQRGIRPIALNQAPYLQLVFDYTGPARFLHEVMGSDEPMCNATKIKTLSINSTTNLRREVNMLARAQNIVLFWYRNRNSHNVNMQMFEDNEALYENLKNFTRHFFQEFDVNGTYATSEIPEKITFIVVLRRCLEFALWEYARHSCHPAHRTYAHALDPIIIQKLDSNNRILNNANTLLERQLRRILGDNNLLNAFRARLSNLPFQAVYSRYGNAIRNLKLRIVLLCPNESNVIR